MIKLMKIVTTTAVFSCLVPALPAQAEKNACQPIRLLIQANLDLARPAPLTGWSGTVKGLLNDTIPLNGMVYAAPGGPVPTVYTGQVGHEVFRFVFDFGPAGKFVNAPDRDLAQYSPSVSPHLTFPPRFAFGRTMATVKIVPDGAISSGWFTNASGSISIVGMFVVNGPPPVDMGFWNAEAEGKLCGAATP
jgi:hypothetical protein